MASVKGLRYIADNEGLTLATELAVRRVQQFRWTIWILLFFIVEKAT